MFERPDRGERALLVVTQSDSTNGAGAEFAELAHSAGAQTVATIVASRERLHPRYCVGTGKAREIAERVAQDAVELVLVDQTLTPAQERNLERLLHCRVLDRTSLILDIFAQRARTHEGKLQVELAQLQHLSTRLVRGWSHLERQQGGIGVRGPGEKQLELDKRMLGQRIKQIRKRLRKVRQQRSQGRQARQKAELPTVALVGYTNTGKSTLFNTLTDAQVLQRDQLFATLDPTLRRLEMAPGQYVVVADTVGFISQLPHTLVDAFRATLEEVCEADLLLHVVDAADEDRDLRMADVAAVLKDIGAADIAQLVVMNKIDLISQQPRVDYDADGLPERVWLSASLGEGINLLKQALLALCRQRRAQGWITLRAAEARLRSLLHTSGAVVREECDEQGDWKLQIDIDEVTWQTLASRAGLDPMQLSPEQDSATSSRHALSA